MKDINNWINKQPKWVRFEFDKLKQQIKSLEYALKQAEKCNEITSTMNWHTLGFHMHEKRTLFLLHKDEASKVTTIGEGDVLLIGREKRETT